MKVKTQQEFDAALKQYEETIDPLVQKLEEICEAQGCGILVFAVPVELVEDGHTVTVLRGTARVAGVNQGGSEFLHMLHEVSEDPESLGKYIATKHLKGIFDSLGGLFDDAEPGQDSPAATPFPPGHA